MIPEQRLYSMKEQIPDGEINILQAILSCNIDTELESDAIRMKMRMIERFMTNRNLWDMFLWTWNGETLFDDAIRNNMYELVVFLKKNFEFVMGPGTINAFNTLIRVPNGRRSFAEIQSIVKIWKLLPISLMIPFPTMINITESNRGRFSEDLFEESYEILLEED
jgi:hypothetical protein